MLTTADRPPHRPELASDGLPSQEEDFVRAVETGRSLALGANFVIESQRIALLARDAADRRRTIRVR